MKRMYLSVRSPELAEPLDASARARMEQGRSIGESARSLFPEGVLVPGSSDMSEAVEATRRALTSGAPAIFEATFVHGDLLVRCDVLERAAGGWNLYEVKASGRVKDEHVTDLAFQSHVLAASGIDVVESYVVHLATRQAREDPEIEVRGLFAVARVTSAVRSEAGAVADWITASRRTLEAEVPPDERTNTHCHNPPCPFRAHCHQGQPEDDVVFLPGIRRTTVTRFREEGVETIRQVPFSAKLTPAQERARRVVTEGTPFVGPQLKSVLETIAFPAHFVDFETAAPILPLHTGMSPFESFPFQWSDQILTAPFDEPQEVPYLHQGKGDPRNEFVSRLLDPVREAKTVVYYSPYELTTLKALERSGITGAKELVQIFTERGFDLLNVIREHVYFEGFRGSFSIKAVLPVVVPELSYKDLAIQNGDVASQEYLALTNEGLDPAQREETMAALLEYCRLDTLAMVRLYQELLRRSGGV